MILGFAAVRATPEECVEAGWRWVEIDMTSHPLRTFTQNRIDSLKFLAKQNKATLSLHTAGLTLAEPVAELLVCQKRYFFSLIDLAEKLGARFLVFHLGNCFCPENNAQLFRDAARRRALELLQEAAAYAEGKVGLVLENSFPSMGEIRQLGERVDDIEFFLKAVPSLGFCLDVGHSHGETVYVERFGGRMVSMHVHDNDGKADSHLLPGKGVVDWNSIKECIQRFEGPVVLEVFSVGPTEAKDLKLF